MLTIESESFVWDVLQKLNCWLTKHQRIELQQTFPKPVLFVQQIAHWNAESQDITCHRLEAGEECLQRIFCRFSMEEVGWMAFFRTSQSWKVYGQTCTSRLRTMSGSTWFPRHSKPLQHQLPPLQASQVPMRQFLQSRCPPWGSQELVGFHQLSSLRILEFNI